MSGHVQSTGESKRPAAEPSRQESREGIRRGDAEADLAPGTRTARVAALTIAPVVVLVGHGSHPWIGEPGHPDFLIRLEAAVLADPVRWGVSHLLVGVGSGLLILAFLALRGYLRDAGENRWSATGLPFVVMGSVLYAMLPAMEVAPLAAARAGADVAAVQGAMMPWFAPMLLAAAALFGLGVIGFCGGIIRSRIAGAPLLWVVVGGLVVMAVTRFLPVGAAQLYVGPAAALVGLWPLAYLVAKRPPASIAGGGPAHPSRRSYP